MLDPVTSSETESVESLPATVNRLAAAMSPNGWLTTGELAELRRLNTEAPDRPAFWRVLAAYVSKDKPIPFEQESRWALILSNMARMAPFHHQPGQRLGQVLAERGFHEQRLMRLLRSEGHTFDDAIRRTCHFLAAKAAPVDWLDLARLILTRKSQKAEEIRRSIARDYYDSLQRKEKGETP